MLTFAQATYVFHTMQLGYGLVSWATRGVFVGEHHAYLSAQIDDLFLASTIYPGTGVTYRMTGHDMQALADWQTARRADPMTAGLRLAWAANLQGSRGVANDPLTAKAVELGPTFALDQPHLGPRRHDQHELRDRVQRVLAERSDDPRTSG